MFFLLENYIKTYPELKEHIDSIKVISLLHDVSLIGTFQKVNKNATVRGSDGKNLRKENGKLMFVERESFDPFPEAQPPFPHGQLSNMIIKQYIKITRLEDMAINWHQGSQDLSKSFEEILKRSQKIHRLVLFTHFADQEAKIFHQNKKE